MGSRFAQDNIHGEEERDSKCAKCGKDEVQNTGLCMGCIEAKVDEYIHTAYNIVTDPALNTAWAVKCGEDNNGTLPDDEVRVRWTHTEFTACVLRSRSLKRKERNAALLIKAICDRNDYTDIVLELAASPKVINKTYEQKASMYNAEVSRLFGIKSHGDFIQSFVDSAKSKLPQGEKIDLEATQEQAVKEMSALNIPPKMTARTLQNRTKSAYPWAYIELCKISARDEL